MKDKLNVFKVSPNAWFNGLELMKLGHVQPLANCSTRRNIYPLYHPFPCNTGTIFITKKDEDFTMFYKALRNALILGILFGVKKMIDIRLDAHDKRQEQKLLG